MDRRNFFKTAAATAAGFSLADFTQRTHANLQSQKSGKAKFHLNYAPHFGQFKEMAGEDLLDQLRFIADEGFTALEDNGMMSRTKEVQESIAKTMDQLGLKMGEFVASPPFRERTFVLKDDATREMLKKRMQQAVETAQRVNTKWCLVVPGQYDKSLDWGYQTANVIDNLKWCAEICEPAGAIIALEPLNTRINHPGVFLTTIAQAYQICKAVNSPSCKILDDLYHQQITEGNLINNIDMAWDEIAYFHLGDNPGRHEPTTGEINYKNIFRHLYQKGYQGVLGMEHSGIKPGKEGEAAIIAAYRGCDDFET